MIRDWLREIDSAQNKISYFHLHQDGKHPTKLLDLNEPQMINHTMIQCLDCHGAIDKSAVDRMKIKEG
jgi:hypothetical protein